MDRYIKKICFFHHHAVLPLLDGIAAPPPLPATTVSSPHSPSAITSPHIELPRFDHPSPSLFQSARLRCRHPHLLDLPLLSIIFSITTGTLSPTSARCHMPPFFPSVPSFPMSPFHHYRCRVFHHCYCLLLSLPT